MKNKEPQIVYIAGYGRSGSTLLSLLLNTVPKVVNLGEVDNLYREKGDDFSEFWTQVRNNTIAQIEQPDLKQNPGQKVSSRRWYFKKRNQAYHKFTQLWSLPTQQAAQQYDATVLVDASKSTAGTFARPIYLKKMGYTVKVIHLVREPHGVMASYKKGRNVSNSETLAPAKAGGALRGLISWFFTNVYTSLVYKRRFTKSELFVLTYEQLMQDYNGQMTALFRFLELELPTSLLQEEILLDDDISFSGNRLRLQKSITINPYKIDKGKGALSLLARLLNRIYKSIEPRYGRL